MHGCTGVIISEKEYADSRRKRQNDIPYITGVLSSHAATQKSAGHTQIHQLKESMKVKDVLGVVVWQNPPVLFLDEFHQLFRIAMLWAPWFWQSRNSKVP